MDRDSEPDSSEAGFALNDPVYSKQQIDEVYNSTNLPVHLRD